MVCRRRSAQAVSSQGQKRSSWVYSGGTRSKNLRRALWHLERLQVSARARRRMQKETYSVRSRWHISSTLQALAASRQRFTWVTSFSEPGGSRKWGWSLVLVSPQAAAPHGDLAPTFPKRCHGHTTNLMPQNLLQTPTLNKIKLFSTFGVL